MSIETRLRRAYPDHEWGTVSREIAFGGADVFRLTGPSELYVKITAEPAHPDPGFSAIAEAERLEWLRDSQIPAPTVVDSGVDDGHEYLVSTRAPGRCASDPWPAHRRDAVIDALADFARDLHSLPSGDCPYDRGLDVTVPLAGRAVALGLVDVTDFDDERLGRTAEQVLDTLTGALDTVRPEREALCHGDFCLPNVLLDPESLRVTAIIDVGRFGRADPYSDLALMTRSVSSPHMNHQFTPEHAERFLRRYGAVPPDRGRIEFYRALDEFR